MGNIIAMRCDCSMRRDIRRIARKLHISRQKVVENALHEYIERAEGMQTDIISDKTFKGWMRRKSPLYAGSRSGAGLRKSLIGYFE